MKKPSAKCHAAHRGQDDMYGMISRLDMHLDAIAILQNYSRSYYQGRMKSASRALSTAPCNCLICIPDTGNDVSHNMLCRDKLRTTTTAQLASMMFDACCEVQNHGCQECNEHDMQPRQTIVSCNSSRQSQAYWQIRQSHPESAERPSQPHRISVSETPTAA